MKKLITLSFLGLLLVACEEKSTNQVTMNDDGEITISKKSLEIIHQIEKDYKACRDAAESRSDCKNFTTESLAKFYQITDEELMKDGEYINYDKLPELVENSENWSLIGDAEDQSTLNKAQTASNTGHAVIAFIEDKKGGHVAMIIPGEMRMSNKWKLKCPNSAGFFRHKTESYTNKQLSYSFRSPEDLVVYKHN